MLDPRSPIGKIRLRIGDWGDVPILPDEVVIGALEEHAYHLPSAAKTCAGYILATLSQKTHKRALQIEVWGQEAFANYLTFLRVMYKDPAISDMAPLPYCPSSRNEILEFVNDWRSGK